MRSKYFMIYLLWLVVSPLSTLGQSKNFKMRRIITPCDKQIGEILCDEFQQQMSDCAELMPADEQSFFWKCGQEHNMITEENARWDELLGAVCNNTKKQLENAYRITDCWDGYMSEAIEKNTLQDDSTYPAEHFQCKLQIFKDAVMKASCPCQLMKRFICNTGKRLPW